MTEKERQWCLEQLQEIIVMYGIKSIDQLDKLFMDTLKRRKELSYDERIKQDILRITRR